MAKVLAGLRIVEMGAYISGPAAAMQLGDLGADVIKVERPDAGDPFRAFKGGLYSPHFQTWNRNKRSIALDTTEEEDRATFHQLIADADVFIQNFRPGIAEKLGCGEAELREINPRLIYCAISGFGTSGPDSDRAAFDTVAQAASGFLRLIVMPDKPRVTGPAIADGVTGLYAALGILAAVVERNATGIGRRVDISMLEAMCHFNIDSFTHRFAVNEVMTPYSRPSVSQSYVFRCRDDKWIAFHLSSPEKFWTGLIDAVGRPELLTDPRFRDRPSRIANQEALIAVLAPVFMTRSRSEWCQIMREADVPFAAAYDSDEALEDPQARHLGIQVETTHPVTGLFRSVRNPLTFDGEHDLPVEPPPMLNANEAEIRRGLENR